MHFAFTLQRNRDFLLQSVTGHEKQTKRAPDHVRMLFEADVVIVCAIFRSVGFRVENLTKCHFLFFRAESRNRAEIADEMAVFRPLEVEDISLTRCGGSTRWSWILH